MPAMSGLVMYETDRRLKQLGRQRASAVVHSAELGRTISGYATFKHGHDGRGRRH